MVGLAACGFLVGALGGASMSKVSRGKWPTGAANQTRRLSIPLDVLWSKTQRSHKKRDKCSLLASELVNLQGHVILRPWRSSQVKKKLCAGA